jgi:peptide/nickel transport system substrate-binding protein
LKKEAKTFTPGRARCGNARALIAKVFWCFFSRKNGLLLLCAAAPHHGGTLHLTASSAAGTIDPHINYTSAFNQIYAFLTDGLVTFRKVGGAAGAQIVPDLAEAMPTVADAGRTYIFKLRHGVFFSDGREVTVEDVAASLRRMFKVLGPNVGSWYNIIIGADACLTKPAACTLQGGVETDSTTNTVTIHIKKPSGEFLDQMSMPFASVLPADTPPHDLGTTPPITTGAYHVVRYDPTRELLIERNPYFHQWSADAQPEGYVDRMVYRFGLQDESELTAVENGEQDWMFEDKPLDRLQEIGAQYASLAHIETMSAYELLEMNVNLPPFNNILARQAVALAVNRRAVVNLYGGPALATPLCQLLPKGIAGFVEYCPFSNPPGERWVAPDLARAQALVRQSGTAGQSVTLITSDKEVERTIGVYLQSVLADIGYAAKVRTVSNNIEFTYIQNSNNRVQIAVVPWFQDYPEPSDFLNVMLSCASFHPGSDASINYSGFCDPAIDAEMQHALELGATDKNAATQIWSDVDRKLTDAAPMTAMFQIRFLDLISPRVHNFVFSSIYHMLFAEAWVQ